MMHIIERFFLHFMVCGNLVLYVFAFLNWRIRKTPLLQKWLTTDKLKQLMIASALVAAIVPLREIADVYAGNNGIVKACTDVASWWLGAGCAWWALYRFDKNGC